MTTFALIIAIREQTFPPGHCEVFDIDLGMDQEFWLTLFKMKKDRHDICPDWNSISNSNSEYVTSLMANVASLATAALTAGNGILRLAPTWAPRSFLQRGRRLKLHPDDYYALGMHRGGIDERWFGSTTEAANDNRNADEGLSYVVHDGQRFLLRDVVAELKSEIIGDHIWNTFKKWPVYSKFFDNMGPIPHHMHQNAEQAAKVGQEGKPESYYFPPQMNAIGNNFASMFM